MIFVSAFRLIQDIMCLSCRSYAVVGYAVAAAGTG
jgi:hypothetical protein